MIVSVNRRMPRTNRAAFTLLEVLVVVAILVILASVAGVYIFGYLEKAKNDTAQQQIGNLENACKSFMAMNGGMPPDSLEMLVAPPQGSGFKVLIEGGLTALMDPWQKPYSYDPSNVDVNGNPDPVVMTTGQQGEPIYSARRQNMMRQQ